MGLLHKPHAFILAIHVVTDQEIVAADAGVALNEGADGIIVIKDYMTQATDDDVMVAYDNVRAKYPRAWIGVNLLGHQPHQAVLKVRRGTSGVWIDNPHIDEEEPDPVAYLAEVRSKMEIWHQPHPVPLLLPSIDFKYQKPAKSLENVARLAGLHSDILITSGTATGKAADLEKVKRLRAATDCPIGLASGVSVENVKKYLDLGVNVFIVNTSVSTNGRLDPQKVGALRKNIPHH